MNNDVEIITVDATNVAQHGFFCYKSKPKSEGYRRKLDWLEQRFAENMQIKVNAVNAILKSAGELGIQARVVELENCREAQDLSPSAYGLFGVVYDGKLLSYRYLDHKELLKRLKEHQE